MKKFIPFFPVFFCMVAILVYTGCNGVPESGSSEIPVQKDNKEELQGLLKEKITAAIKFAPQCNIEYTTNIYNRVLVADCGNVTAAEKKEMVDELEAKAKNSAGQICGLNP